MSDDDQINVGSKSSNEKQKEDYEESDVREIFKEANPASWDDVVNYIRSKGDETWHITPGEAKSMLEDFQKLAESGKEFTPDPVKAYEMAHGEEPEEWGE